MRRATRKLCAIGGARVSSSVWFLIPTGSSSAFAPILIPNSVPLVLPRMIYTVPQICHDVWLLNDAGFLLMETQRSSDAGQAFVDMWQ